ncbi:ComEA family DNA-binding protein [Microcella humidisoli]|uniref:ComEA family DNA-binding protein n=1 Tax=Microcella humidisoli TaxID=2963406 RepID=A0ABY5FW86_9MICO|nr:ComEA family DNA-binding protein [Microcella humidisoli]UTT62558.1 ComEA family DNA-binding protein [Microcella humidisoli]
MTHLAALDGPPRRSPRVRAALGGVVVLALLGVGAAVVGAVVTPGGQTVTVEAPVAVDGATPGPAPAIEVVVLHVLGAVSQPGIVELPLGARVVDAIAAAGGPSDDADLAGVNLARVVVDGEQLRVPRVGEVPVTAPAAPGSAGGATGDGRVNLNTADAAALETLPGVGPAIAARIIAWRDENGPFRSVDELTAVSGIGEKTLAGLRDQATV